MNDRDKPAVAQDSSEGQSRKFPFTRKEDYKKEIVGGVLGIVTAIFLSGSGVLRWGKHTADDDKQAMAELRTHIYQNYYTRDDVNGKFSAFKESVMEKHNICTGDISALKDGTGEIREDIRSLHSTIAGLPPPVLVNKVERNSIRIEHLEADMMRFIGSHGDGRGQ